MHTLTLIDGSGFVFRAFHALPSLTAPNGTPIGAVLGFYNMLFKWMENHPPECWAVALDQGGSTFRKSLFPAYKAHRPLYNPDIRVQFEIIQNLCQALRIPILRQEGVEADDLLASAVELALMDSEWNVVLVSSDKDLGQLVGPRVRLFDPIKETFLDEKIVEDLWGVPVSKIAFVQALAGDTSDNIPGIPGVGPKTAAAWIREFGDIETLLGTSERLPGKKRDLVERYADQARLCYQLVCLKKDVDLGISIKDFIYEPPDNQAVEKILDQYGLQGLKKRLIRKGLLSLPMVSDAPMVGVVSLVWDPKEEKVYAYDAAQDPEGKGAKQRVLSSEELAERWADSSCLKILHDAKGWIHRMPHGDPNTLYFEDVMVLSSILYGGHAGHDISSIMVRLGLPWEENLQAYRLWQSWKQLEVALREAKAITVYTCLDRPLIPILASMEHTGIRVNVAYLASLARQWDQEIQELEVTIYELAGKPFHIASAQQLGEVLFEDLQWPKENKWGIQCGKRGKSGAYGTSGEVLSVFAAKGYSLAHHLLQWRQLSKLKNTYTTGLIRQVNPDTGRLRSTYSMVTTSTGRLSSLRPNVQNIPIRTDQGRKIRHAFQAAPGYGLLCLDYSQIELRLLAHMGAIPSLQKAFQREQDIHQETACALFDCPSDGVTKEMRRMAKIINFGILYGMSPFGLGQQLALEPKNAKKLMDQYFEQHPGILSYIEVCKERARQNGYVTTLWGRRCFIPHIHSRNYGLRSGAERQAINGPLQGTSADLMKRAMIQMDQWIRTQDREVKMLLQVHDEIILEVNNHDREPVERALTKIMESAAQLSIPLKVKGSFAPIWGAIE